ncbi:ankyrin repeat and EF-Hand domain-containing protein 1 family [Trichomonas vaginalis G3]|nr:ankyrin repeat and EF-Hand domain-containing protein 1 family [Trichomonas vaginalis G3]KAI5491768.1 ankyrin repeat and EF-Hand domain-containing protein 1 family [Trichomonas vaginalis G3]
MSCALQHLNVNDHYAVVLYEKIDKTVERIESDSFKLFEKCLETNEQFQYNGPLRTTNYQSIGHYGLVLRNSQNYIDLANNSTFVQKSLAFRTFHNRENIGLFINFDPFPYKDAKAKPIPYYPDYDYDDYDDYGGGPDFDEVDEIDFVDDDEVL